jgi:hypothetical protein
VTIRPASAGPITPKLREFKIRGLEAKLEEVDPGRKWELTATLTDPLAMTRVRGELVVETGVAQAPDLKINVFGMLAPRVVTEPRSVVVPANRKPDWSTRVHLAWDGPDPGRITSAHSEEPAIKAVVEEKGHGKQEVVITIDEGFKPTPRGYAVIMDTSDKDMPRIVVPLRFMELTAAARRAATTPPRRPGAAQAVPAVGVSGGKAAADAPAGRPTTSDTAPPKQASETAPPE